MDNKKDWLMVSKYDIGEKVYSKAKQSMVEIRGIIFSVHRKGYSIQYTTTTNEILAESDLKNEAPLLDETEKRFLKNFLIPLKAKKIRKIFTEDKEYECIDYLIGKVWLSLPVFKKGTMYNGLKLGKAYTIKELELDEKQYKY